MTDETDAAAAPFIVEISAIATGEAVHPDPSTLTPAELRHLNKGNDE